MVEGLTLATYLMPLVYQQEKNTPKQKPFGIQSHAQYIGLRTGRRCAVEISRWPTSKLHLCPSGAGHGEYFDWIDGQPVCLDMSRHLQIQLHQLMDMA